ncbi:olfactory receptor 13H1-like [Cynocephalus volans]|uniref:olfactory receptor 13H1-like n=1 Tax=Cynocephalus volans TaxID=110931 RepID=UPI002FC8018F
MEILLTDNGSEVTEFILVGLSNHPKSHIAMYYIMLVVYLITLMGHSLIITVVRVDGQLHTLMYFFLSNLSFLDICYSSNSVPFMLFNVLRNYPTISYRSCYAQKAISLSLGMTEWLLLAVMAYDRFVAISSPLHYTIIMNNQVCIQLAMVTWASALLLAIIPIIAFPAHFCGHHVINHFTCEVKLILPVEARLLRHRSQTYSGSSHRHIHTAPAPHLHPHLLYSHVVAVLRIRSAETRFKAFPPVDPTQLSSPYFMGQPSTCA